MAQSYLIRRGSSAGGHDIPAITYTGSYIDYLIKYGDTWYYELCMFSSGVLTSDKSIQADVCGIGGGGGGGVHTSNAPGSGGGGSGSFGYAEHIDIAANTGLPITIGAGGAISTQGGSTTCGTFTCNGGLSGGADSSGPPYGGNGGNGGSGGAAGGDLGSIISSGTVTQGLGGTNGSNGGTTGTRHGTAGVGGGIAFCKFGIAEQNIAASAKSPYVNSASDSIKSVGGQGGNGIDISGLLNALIAQQTVTTPGYAGNGYGAGGSGGGNLSGGATAGYQGLLFLRTKL